MSCSRQNTVSMQTHSPLTPFSMELNEFGIMLMVAQPSRLAFELAETLKKSLAHTQMQRGPSAVQVGVAEDRSYANVSFCGHEYEQPCGVASGPS